MNLRKARIGQTVRVICLEAKGPLRRRLMDMGITKGVILEVKKVAPLGDPIEISLRGYSLSIRKSDAEEIIVAAVIDNE